MVVSHQDLQAFCIQAMTACGMSEHDARTTANVLVTNDLLGIFTHGTKCLRGYLKRMRAGGLNAAAVPEIIREGPAWAVLDGHSAMAMVTCCKAMDVAIEKARTTGIAYAGVKNSCHIAAAGFYALMAARQDMIGLSMSNENPSMTVPGARGPIIGTNPFAVAIPAGEEKPVLLDIATSTVAASKVYAAVSQGKPIPNNWIVDKEGIPTTDGSLYPHSAYMLPMAGHKGYGLALMIEVLSALLSSGASRNDVMGWVHHDPSKPTGQCHAFIAINVGAIVPLDVFKSRMDEMIRDVRRSPKAKGSDRIYLPGEMEWEKYDKATKSGIPLPEDVVENLRGLADDLGMEFKMG